MKLVLEKFSKSFGPVSVIENLDLTVHSGEMLALLGPSGCGKSTTLFSICGIYRMNSGKLLFDQKDMSNVPSQQRNVGVEADGACDDWPVCAGAVVYPRRLAAR